MQQEKYCQMSSTINCQHKNCSEKLDIFNVMIEITGKDGCFYGHKSCKKCKGMNYFLWCQCGNPILRNIPFFEGEPLKCPVNKCNRKNFQIVRCPNEDCLTFNEFENNGYIMGNQTSCSRCNQQFQQVACFFCHQSSYFDGDYQQSQSFRCPSSNCKDRKCVQHLNCPNKECQYPNRFDKLIPFTPYSCKGCSKNFLFINCPHCKEAHVINEAEFQFGKQFRCGKCSKQLSLDECPDCQKINLRSTDKQSGDFGRRQCACKKKYILLPCPQCKKVSNVIDKYQDDVFQFKCECNCISYYLTCPKCCSGKVINPQSIQSDTNTVECKDCKTKVKHNISQDASRLVCKICLESNSEYICHPCNHLVACEACAKILKSNAINGKVKCPLCRQPGTIGKIFI